MLLSSILWSFRRTLAQLLNFTMILNIASMSGNPFINMFLQAFVEIPGFCVGRILCDRFGRRWSQAAAYLIGMMIQLACLITVIRKYDHFTAEFDNEYSVTECPLRKRKKCYNICLFYHWTQIKNAVKMCDTRTEKRTESRKLRGRVVEYIYTGGTVCQDVN